MKSKVITRVATGRKVAQEVQIDELLSGAQSFVQLLSRYKAEVEAERVSAELSYVDLIMASDEALTVSQIAMDYGMSAVRFNELLHDVGIQYKQNGQWLLYARYRDKGLTKSVTLRRYHHRTGVPFTIVHTLWTQQGRRFLYDSLRPRGIVPLMEQSGAEAVKGVSVRQVLQDRDL